MSMLFFLRVRRPPRPTLFPYTSSSDLERRAREHVAILGTRWEAIEHERHESRSGHVRRRRSRRRPAVLERLRLERIATAEDRKSTRLNSSHSSISYAVFCLTKKKNHQP